MSDAQIDPWVAIGFALHLDDSLEAMDFLDMVQHGNAKGIEKEWPDFAKYGAAYWERPQ